jgi:hypothetical protein
VKRYADSCATLGHVKDRPFVLAVAAVDSPHATLACQRAIEAVLFGYYVDEERYLREGGDLKGRQIDSVAKDNGSDVGIGIFRDEEFNWLSAVMFSSCATWGKVRALSSDPNPTIVFDAVRYNPNGLRPHIVKAKKSQYTESLLDGLRVYHNPQATHKLDPRVFCHRDVFQSYFSESSDDWVYEHREGLLLFRRIETFVSPDRISPSGSSRSTLLL